MDKKDKKEKRREWFQTSLLRLMRAKDKKYQTVRELLTGGIYREDSR